MVNVAIGFIRPKIWHKSVVHFISCAMNRTATTFLFLLFLLFFPINTHSAEKKTAPSLTMEEIANTTLSIDFNGEANKQKIKLKNGHYEKRKKGSNTLSVDLTTWVKFTDLDKDGSEDAAVIFVWNKGREEIFYELAALLNKKGKPVHVSSADLGDRVVIQALEVSADTVLLNMLTRGKGEGACCPTLSVKLRYMLQASGLVEQTDYLGIYQLKTTDKADGGLKIRMSVNSDNTVNMVIQYSASTPPEMKVGRWNKQGDGSLLVDFRGRNPSGTDLIYFRFLNNKLTSMLHDENIYRAGDLEFERVSK